MTTSTLDNLFSTITTHDNFQSIRIWQIQTESHSQIIITFKLSLNFGFSLIFSTGLTVIL